MTDRQRGRTPRRRSQEDADPPSAKGGQARRDTKERAARESAYTDELLDAIDDVLRAGLGLDEDEAVDEAEFERASQAYVSSFVQKGGE
jgi:hypothetical protein